MRASIRRFFQRILQINDTPESIALGTAVGLFVGMTPTVGIQMIIVVVVGTFIRANRIAAVAMVYISNPLTVVPIYWLDYWVGAKVFGYEIIDREQFLNAEENLWDTVVAMGADVTVPLFLGGTLLGLVLAVPAYPVTLRMVRATQKRREHKKALLQLREQRRLERERRKEDEAEREAEV